MTALLLIILLIAPLLWATGFLLVTDFSVPSQDARQFHRVLAIFPHPDDEAVSCGGFLHRASKWGTVVTLVIPTKGERGTLNLTLDVSLKDIRTREAQAATTILEISRLIQNDLGDGELHDNKEELKKYS